MDGIKALAPLLVLIGALLIAICFVAWLDAVTPRPANPQHLRMIELLKESNELMRRRLNGGNEE